MKSETLPFSIAWKPACALLAGYAAVLVAAGIGFSSLRAATPIRTTLCFLLIETVAVGVGAPFLWATQRQRNDWRAAIAGILLPLLGIEMLTLAACGAFSARTHAALFLAQVFLLAFALLLTAAAAFLVSLHRRAATAQLMASLLALAMIGNVLYTNPAIEGLTGGRSRPIVLAAILWTNPWMIVAGSILQEDPLRATDLYTWSVIKYYGFDYPAASVASTGSRALLLAGVYAAAALALWAIPRGVRGKFRGAKAIEN